MLNKQKRTLNNGITSLKLRTKNLSDENKDLTFMYSDDITFYRSELKKIYESEKKHINNLNIEQGKRDSLDVVIASLKAEVKFFKERYKLSHINNLELSSKRSEAAVVELGKQSDRAEAYIEKLSKL